MSCGDGTANMIVFQPMRVTLRSVGAACYPYWCVGGKESASGLLASDLMGSQREDQNDGSSVGHLLQMTIRLRYPDRGIA